MSTLLVYDQPGIHYNPQVPSAGVWLCQSLPSPCWCFATPKGRTFYLSLSNFMRFLLAQSSRLLRCHGTEALPAVTNHWTRFRCRSQICWGCTLGHHPSPCWRWRTVASQILDNGLLTTTEVWHEQCSWVPVAVVTNKLPSCSCCLSCKLLTAVWLFPLVQRQESFKKGDVKGLHP